MNIFSILASVVSIYTLLCFVRVMLSWFPGAEYSRFGQVLRQMCDPYLDIFRRFRFLRFSSFDFTPAIGLCVLMALQAFFNSLAMGKAFRISTILSMLVMLVGNIFTSVLGFFAVIILVRLIVYLIIGDGQGSYSIWTAMDRAISPIIFRIAGAFFRGQSISFVKALVTSLIALLLSSVLISYVIRVLGGLISLIPF
ncbi:MAG: YggT family protein [Treponema sp.]|uniref:YggT family protein n=1 Tax=Treponema sp. TaxID=166 RepID=UPI0025F26B8C|nr:YggT family protein [Treponema sp.]MBQ9622723.1 YggT family protein [Treponema sp.]MBR0100835.1 YggT family protein [Treponema sp.]MBR0494584.1 YggT family protein [Treponema sp.]